MFCLPVLIFYITFHISNNFIIWEVMNIVFFLKNSLLSRSRKFCNNDVMVTWHVNWPMKFYFVSFLLLIRSSLAEFQVYVRPNWIRFSVARYTICRTKFKKSEKTQSERFYTHPEGKFIWNFYMAEERRYRIRHNCPFLVSFCLFHISCVGKPKTCRAQIERLR